MSADPINQYLYKLAEGSIVSNRTISIIGEDDGSFIVQVTDRDYQYDPTGQAQTIGPRERYDSIDKAKEAAQKQFDDSIGDGFLENKIAGPPY
jgi:hypothetical protein